MPPLSKDHFSQQRFFQTNRVEGFDIARALAIYGMMVVHFMLVMTDGTPSEGWSKTLLEFLDGRPAATFMVLAGIGITLMSRNSDGSSKDRTAIRRRLRIRGGFLLACGFLNLVIWEGDILRVYGISLLLAPWLLGRVSRTLLLWAAAFLVTFVVLFLLADYDKNWDWTSMKYNGLWTSSGLIRSLFFDGFRSVFPWTGMLIAGMWLGRLDWRGDAVPRKAMAWGAALVVSSIVLSRVMLSSLRGHLSPEFGAEAAKACFGLASMPPLPLFLANAGGCALLVIASCTLISRKAAGSRLLRVLASTGRMAFTWYVAHIVIGLGGVIALGWIRTSHVRALMTATAFFALAGITSTLWLRRFSNGPLESLLRRISGG